MTGTDWRNLTVSFLVAGLGALAFHAISFPSAPLTGSAVAISIAGLAGLRTELPIWMRNGAFILIGINIGTAVTPEMLASIIRWPISIAMLLLSLFVSMQLASAVLVRFLGFDRLSATLASAPGHLSYVLSMALEGNADLSRIAIVQSIRVLFITLLVPLFVATWFGTSGIEFLPATVMTPAALAVSLVLTLLTGILFTRLRLPAAYLLAGMGVSIILHALDLTPGRMPDLLNMLAFLVMGMLIGSRFSGQTWQSIRGALAAGLWVTGITTAVALAGAAAVGLLLGLPMSMLIVAFAPGGVEAMAAIAVMLGIDPAFVAAHHVARLLLLTLLVPLLTHRLR